MNAMPSLSLVLRCDLKCPLCRREYEQAELDDLRVVAAFCGVGARLCGFCLKPLTEKQWRKCCERFSRWSR